MRVISMYKYAIGTGLAAIMIDYIKQNFCGLNNCFILYFVYLFF